MKKLQRNIVNTFAEKVDSVNWIRRRTMFSCLPSQNLLGVQELLTDDLEVYFGLTSCSGELTDEDNSLKLSFVQDEPVMVRFEVKCAHISQKTH